MEVVVGVVVVVVEMTANAVDIVDTAAVTTPVVADVLEDVS